MTWNLTVALILLGRYADFMAAIAAIPGPRVPRAMTLRQYLDEVAHLPRWKQRLLLRNGAVRIQTTPPDGGSPGPITNPDHVLSQDDVVEYDETNSAYVSELMPRIANAKDYAFVPPHDDDDRFMIFMKELQERKGATVLANTDIEPTATLEQFVENIGKDDGVPGPPRNLVIVSHAHFTGQLGFSPTIAAAAEEQPLLTTYETIDLAPERLNVPDEYLKDRKGENVPPTLVFTGCDIGNAEPFLKKLRNVMNPRFRVYAPKHWFGGARTPDQELYFEYMAKSFYVHSPSPLLRAGLILALKALPSKDRKDVWDDDIPDSAWEGWVPPEPWPTTMGFVKEHPIEIVMPRLTLGTRTFPERTANLPGELYIFNADLKGSVPTTVPKSVFDSNAVLALRQTVASLGSGYKLSDLHLFPLSKRFRLGSADELISQTNWDPAGFRYETTSGGNRLHARGTAFKYCLLVPITERRPSRKVVANYYLAGSPEPIRNDLGFDKTRFWGQIPPG
jgi:hypothetical protein